jgi:hypothetical protein
MAVRDIFKRRDEGELGQLQISSLACPFCFARTHGKAQCGGIVGLAMPEKWWRGHTKNDYEAGSLTWDPRPCLHVRVGAGFGAPTS